MNQKIYEKAKEFAMMSPKDQAEFLGEVDFWLTELGSYYDDIRNIARALRPNRDGIYWLRVLIDAHDSEGH